MSTENFKPSCGCDEWKCGMSNVDLDFITTPWDIPELFKVSCTCLECSNTCDECVCDECKCSDEVEHYQWKN